VKGKKIAPESLSGYILQPWSPDVSLPALERGSAMRPICFALGLLLLSTFSAYSQVSQPSQAEGRVVGTVLDEQGQPINGAQVCTQVSLPSKINANCVVRSDKTGQFQVKHLAMGTFGVYAEKREDGYAGSDQLGGIQTVTLTPDAPLAQVILKFALKSGILAPSVKDKVTGKPVCNFLIQWHAIPADSVSIAGGAGFSQWTTRTSIPAEKDVFIDEVSARGYQKLLCTDPADPSKPLKVHLQHGEVKLLTFELEPDNTAAR